MDDRAEEPGVRLVGWGVFGLSLLLYLVTLAPCAVPGWSARYIVAHAGLGPFPAVAHPLWTWAAQLLKLVPLGGLAFRLNLFSAVCGAATVFLVYDLVRRIPHNRRWEETESRFPAAAVQMLSGATAAGVLALMLPCWILATRANPLMLDTLLFVFALRLLADVVWKPGSRALYGLAFACGLGTAEYGLFVPLVPLCALFVVGVLWRRKLLESGRLAIAAGLYALGLTPWFLLALQARLSPGASWLGLHSYFAALWEIWRWEWIELRAAFPRVGWLLMALVSVIPFLVVMVPFRSHTWTARIGSYALNALAAALAAAILFDTRLAPWNVVGFQPIVPPYLLVAAYAGYLAGYGYVLLCAPVLRRNSPYAAIQPLLRRLYVPLIAVVLAAAAWMNLPKAGGQDAAPLGRLTDEMVERFGTRRWLVSNGMLDDGVVIVAYDRGMDLRVVNTSLAGDSAYHAYLGSLLRDPRIEGLLEVGVSPALREWIRARTDPGAEVAVFAVPSLWRAAGRKPVPELIFYGGGEPPDAERLMADHRAFWNAYGPGLQKRARASSPLQPWYRGVLTHISRIANDVGVWMEAENRGDLAREAYETALRLEPESLSAAVNLVRLLRATDPEAARAREAELASARKRPRRLPRAVSSLVFGEFAAARGRSRAGGGTRYDAAELSSAGEVEERDPKAGLRRSLVGLFQVEGDSDEAVMLRQAAASVQGGDPAEAKRQLEELVRRNPKIMRARAALAVLAALDGDEAAIAAPRRELDKARNLHPDVLTAMARVAMAQGDSAAARRYFQMVLRRRPADLSALRALLFIAVREGDEEAVEQLAHRILNGNPREPSANLLLGIQQLADQQYEQAEASFRASLRARESSAGWNNLAWTLFTMGRSDEALEAVDKALAMNPRNLAAWDTKEQVLRRMGREEEADRVLEDMQNIGAARFESVETPASP